MIENLIEAFLIASKIEDIVDLLGQKIFEDKIKMAPQRICPITRNFGNESFLFGIQDHHFFIFERDCSHFKCCSPIRLQSYFENFLCEKIIFL